MDEVVDSKNQRVESAQPTVWRSPVTPIVASDLRQAMEQVVADGTAESMQLPGMTVGAKTGTAQLTGEESATHAWVIGYAGPPGESPTAAVAVIVEAVPGAEQQTGGTVAGPIALSVLDAALG